jgi:hypothetical protein
MQTLKTLRDQVLSWLDEAGDTATTKTNVDNAINQAHAMRCTGERWPFMLWPATQTITLTGATQYPLHEEFGTGLYFRNSTTGSYLVEVPLRQLDQTGTSPLDTDSVQFTIDSYSPLAVQPTYSVVTISSSSLLDTGAAKGVVITGYTSAGGMQTETITPNGLTPVSGSLVFTTITAVTMQDAWVGTMVLTHSGGTVGLVLPAGVAARQYPMLRFYATPATTGTIDYRFYRKPRVLTRDNDIPEIPDPYSQILVWDTLLMFAGYNTDISRQSVEAWRDMQGQLSLSLQHAFLNPQTIGAMPRFVRVIQ